jgi:hypothetical protein
LEEPVPEGTLTNDEPRPDGELLNRAPLTRILVLLIRKQVAVRDEVVEDHPV